MDKTTAIVIVLGILALVFIAFFAVFRKSGKGKIKGPFGTGLEVEGSNEQPQTRIKEVEAGGNIHIGENGGREVDAYKLKAGGHVTIGSLTPPIQEPEKGSHTTNITFQEIIDRIKTAPPFQRNDIEQYFVGLTVDWKTTLCTVEKADDNNLRVYLSIFDIDHLSHGMCVCNVSLAKYPELKILHKDHPIRVVGKIAQFQGADIAYIEEAALFFLAQHPKQTN
jgi:hypothetical protein